MTTKKEEEAIEKNTKKTKKTSKKDEEKKTLVELVESSNVKFTSIVMDLAEHDLLNQYREELEAQEKGITIIPSITEAEFKKIIGD